MKTRSLTIINYHYYDELDPVVPVGWTSVERSSVLVGSQGSQTTSLCTHHPPNYYRSFNLIRIIYIYIYYGCFHDVYNYIYI